MNEKMGFLKENLLCYRERKGFYGEVIEEGGKFVGEEMFFQGIVYCGVDGGRESIKIWVGGNYMYFICLYNVSVYGDLKMVFIFFYFLNEIIFICNFIIRSVWLRFNVLIFYFIFYVCILFEFFFMILNFDYFLLVRIMVEMVCCNF